MNRTTSFATAAILVGATLALVPLPAATPGARAISAAVAIDDTGFHPAYLNILVGETVTWSNLDSVEHTVTSTWTGATPTPQPSPISVTTPVPGALFDMVLGPGESGSFTFDAFGTYYYYCRDHPEETGTIIVAISFPGTPSPTPGTPSPTPSGSGLGSGGTLPDVSMDDPQQPSSPLVALGLLLLLTGSLAAVPGARGARRG